MNSYSEAPYSRETFYLEVDDLNSESLSDLAFFMEMDELQTKTQEATSFCEIEAKNSSSRVSNPLLSYKDLNGFSAAATIATDHFSARCTFNNRA